MQGKTDRARRTTFRGTPRFERVNKLGEGGMGVVYEVFDRERNLRLALKSVQRMSARALLRFKDEFRALRDLHHPNLVRLDELIERDGHWYFTMELIDGVDIVTYGRGEVASSAPITPSDHAAGADERTDETVVSGGARRGPSTAPSAHELDIDERTVREVMTQLARGVVALHRAGSIHRDIKPSNVMVTRGGRVVVLDLGVAASIQDGAGEGEVVGTIAYMAPEQAAGEAVTFASDWYAVGCVLYKMLTGSTPFGGGSDALERKRTLEPAPVSALNPRAPAALAQLCDAMLRRQPADRPSAEEILAVLDPSPRTNRTGDSAESVSGLFVGRRAELEALDQALDRAVGGRATAVVLEGPSGIGKSATAARFLERVTANRSGAVVLRGRCHERESVPFCAFDGIVDDLSKLLTRGLIDTKSLPGNAGRLVRLFPTLATVKPIASRLHDETDDGDSPQERRHRSFRAFTDLLRALCAKQRPVIVSIDDAQRADDDSVALLAHLVRGNSPPPVLWVLTRRTGETAGGDAMVRAVDPLLTTIRLSGLREADARQLVSVLAGEDLGSDVSSMLSETHGHPMFLEELVRHRLRGDGATHESSFDDALRARVAGLPEPARRLLDVVAAGGGPVRQSVCARVAAMDPEAYAVQIEELRAGKLVRITGPRATDVVEPYHDRVCEAVYARIPDDRRRAIHRYLAIELEGEGASAELLANHYQRAGEPTKAAAHYQAAARAAAEILAFDHAIKLYRAALELGDHHVDARRELLTALGGALADSGRPVESAASYLEAAAAGGASAEAELELRRRAAEQYLQAGHIEAGMEASRTLLGHVGLRYPRSANRALAGALWSSVRLRMSSLSWTSRPADRLARDQTAQLDVLWTLSSGLSYVDTFRAFYFTMKASRLSLHVGDELRIARALTAASFNQSVTGKTAQARRLIDAVDRAADSHGSSLARFYSRICHVGWSFWIDNDWQATLDGVEEAAALWRSAGRGAGFEVDVLDQFRAWSMQNLGRFRDAQRLVHRRVRRARRAGNRFIEISFRNYLTTMSLLDDRPDQVIAEADDALAGWFAGEGVFSMQHYWNAVSHSKAALYRGSVEESAPELDRKWDRYNRSLLRRLPLVQTEASSMQGGIALARAAEARARGDEDHARTMLRRARRHIRILESLPIPTAASAAFTLTAGLEHVEDNRDGCIAALRASVDSRTHGAAQYACGLRLGQLVDEPEVAPLVERGRAWLHDERVRNPERLLAVLVPGWL